MRSAVLTRSVSWLLGATLLLLPGTTIAEQVCGPDTGIGAGEPISGAGFEIAGDTPVGDSGAEWTDLYCPGWDEILGIFYGVPLEWYSDDGLEALYGQTPGRTAPANGEDPAPVRSIGGDDPDPITNFGKGNGPGGGGRDTTDDGDPGRSIGEDPDPITGFGKGNGPGGGGRDATDDRSPTVGGGSGGSDGPDPVGRSSGGDHPDPVLGRKGDTTDDRSPTGGGGDRPGPAAGNNKIEPRAAISDSSDPITNLGKGPGPGGGGRDGTDDDDPTELREIVDDPDPITDFGKGNGPGGGGRDGTDDGGPTEDRAIIDESDPVSDFGKGDGSGGGGEHRP